MKKSFTILVDPPFPCKKRVSPQPQSRRDSRFIFPNHKKPPRTSTFAAVCEMFRIAAPAAHHIFPLMDPLPPLAEQLLGAEINKIPHTLVCGILCFRYTIDEHTSCRSGSDQLQNQARFCKMFSLPHGSRRRICPDRLLQNRSDTAGRFYSYDILKNCTFARGKQCTICSVVYCKRREYVVLFLIRKMDSIFGVSLKFIAYSILNVFSGGT